jgi:two-component system NtrC family sensor kinase
MPLREVSRAVTADAQASVRWSRASVIAAFVVPLVVFVGVAALLYQSAFTEARERLERAARIGQEHASRVVETNDVLARVVLAQAGELPDAAIVAGRDAQHARLAQLTAGLDQLQSVWLWSADGRPLLSNRFATPPAGLDVSDREYFAWTRDHVSDAWFVSRPLLSRSTGEPFIDFSRRRTLADGSFGGVVSVSLFPAYFAGFYRELAAREPGLALGLYRVDGAILARWPAPPSLDTRLGSDSALLGQMRAGATQGEAQGRSSIDGVERLVSFRQVGAMPMYVAATLSRESILSAWRSKVTALAAFILPLALTLAYLTWLALHGAERERAALSRYQAEVEQRIRAEEALRQAQKLEALGQITGGVAHDFNNLLMVIGNNAHLARRLLPGAEASPQLAAIHRAIASGSKLTRQLLSFAGRQPLQPTVIELAQALPELLELVRTAVGSAIVVTASVQPDAGAVEVDRAELELALINLALNARDAMPAGGQLGITAGRARPDESPQRGDAACVALAVSDTGEGIAPEVAARVFEPFFTTKGPGRGTGLGLAQVYGFATQAGGSVRLDSAPGKGTTVTIYLPVSGRAPSATPSAAVSALPALAGRVLLVEDNAEIARATAPLIEALGCETVLVASGDEALDLIARDARGFDAVLSDVVMPGATNGLALAQALRRLRPRLPVVLMTGYAAEVDSARSEGFEVLPKPCGPEAIAGVLSRVLQPRRSPATG